MTEAFFVRLGTQNGTERFRATSHTAGPWGPHSQHGGPPAALLGRACEQLASSTGRSMLPSRFTLDLLGPIAVGELAVSAHVVRPGRTVDLCRAEMVDTTADRTVARAHVWRAPADRSGPANGSSVPFAGPASGRRVGFPEHWRREGYLEAIEWSWIRGSVAEPGPVAVWMRPRLPLLPDEPMSAFERVLTCVDSASGVSAELDPRAWGFLNTDLSVHLLRSAQSEWVGLDARTHLGGGSAGLARADVYDESELVGVSAQSLLVASRG